MRTIVGVLRGGPSREYDTSLKTGGTILGALDREKFDVRDIFIDRQGVWHRGGVETLPAKALQDIDVVFNVIHGEFGEDGRLHRVLDTLNVPYTGARAASSILAFNKHHAAPVIRGLGVRVPYSRVLERESDVSSAARELFRTFPHPAIIKPSTGSMMMLAEDFHSLERGLLRAWEISPKVIVEEYIPGRRASVGVIDDFRGEKAYTLLPTDGVRVPGLFTPAEKKILMDTARQIHQALTLDHYSHSDFVVGKRGVYFLEATGAAGIKLGEESPFSKALHAVGVKFAHFLEHVINLARKGHERIS